MGVLIGGTFWLTTMFVNLAIAQEDLKSLKSAHDLEVSEQARRREEFSEKLNRIASDLRMIKGALKIRDEARN